MQFTCIRENLSAGLSVVGHITGRAVTLPILNNILIDAKEGDITLSATNLEIGIQTKVRGKVEHEGLITVPAKIITEYMNLIHDEKVSLEYSGQTISITSDSHKTKIKTTPADEFPLIPIPPQKNFLKLPLGSFLKSLNAVLFAASKDEMRPELTGIYINITNSTLTLAATDSYRLAEARVELPEAVAQTQTVIVPSKVLYELLRVSALTKNTSVEFVLSDNQVLFFISPTLITSRLIDGQYPDYTQIIPQKLDTHAEFVVSDLVDVIKVASLFTKTGINDIELKFSNSQQCITITTLNNQIGENTSSILATIHGPDDVVVFNWRYLLDGLTALGTSHARLEVGSSNHPGVLRPIQEKGSGSGYEYLYLVMPIKQ